MMIGVMFLAFIVQIVFRYILNFPIGWTSELTIIMWLWLVLWGAAFMVARAGGNPLRSHLLRRQQENPQRAWPSSAQLR